MRAGQTVVERVVSRPACGVPGPFSYWTADLDVWAQGQIARFDRRTLSPWHIGNCLTVIPTFFDLPGRVLFGAATAEQVDEWLGTVEMASGATSEPVIEVLTRLRLSACRGWSDCRCPDTVQRAGRIVEGLAALDDVDGPRGRSRRHCSERTRAMRAIVGANHPVQDRIRTVEA